MLNNFSPFFLIKSIPKTWKAMKSNLPTGSNQPNITHSVTHSPFTRGALFRSNPAADGMSDAADQMSDAADRLWRRLNGNGGRLVFFHTNVRPICSRSYPTNNFRSKNIVLTPPSPKTIRSSGGKTVRGG